MTKYEKYFDGLSTDDLIWLVSYSRSLAISGRMICLAILFDKEVK